MNLVRDLSTTKDCQEGSFGMLKGLSKVGKLLGHKETSSTLGEVNTNNGRVGTVSSTKSVVDIDISEGSERLAESSNTGLISLDLLTIDLLRAFFLNVESEILKKNNLAVLSGAYVLFSLRTNGIGKESDFGIEERLKLGSNRLKRVLVVNLTIRSSKMRSKNNGLST